MYLVYFFNEAKTTADKLQKTIKFVNATKLAANTMDWKQTFCCKFGNVIGLSRPQPQ